MKIGIDSTAVGKEPLGIHNYVYQLTKNLLKFDHENDYVIYCRKDFPDSLKKFNKNAYYKICNLKNRKLCELFWLSGAAPKDNLDILHNPGFSLPLFYRRKSVLTIHGLGWRYHSDMHDKKMKLYFKMAAEKTASRATRLIAISEATKISYIEYLGIQEERIDVVYHGIDRRRFIREIDKDELKEFRTKYKLPPKFILYIGAMFKHKNLANLLNAFKQIHRKTYLEEFGLVIAGKKNLQFDNLRRLASKLKIDSKVYFTGYFPDADLPKLYKTADLFVFPSMYEGFGLPVLEAFASGVPVVTSNTTSLPEVAGDAAIFIDPYDVDNIANGIVKVLSDENLQMDLIKKGLERTKKFSWKKTAMKTLEVYKKAMG